MLFRFKFMLEERKRLRLHNHANLRGQLIYLTLVLLAIIALHSVAMVLLEGLSISDAVWLTFTTATTVGYGDFSASTVYGRLTTIILLYIGGIGILAQVVALYFEYRQNIRDKMLRGQWSWNMKDHIVFLNCPIEAGEEYYYQAISQLRASGLDHASRPIIIVSDLFSNGLPERLQKLNVTHVSKPLSDSATLKSASVLQADTVIILSHAHLDPTSDSITFDLIDRLREMGYTNRIIAEAVRDENRGRLKKAGANNVLRPIRSYPELLMRSILAPGSEQVIEKLFDSFGEECIRYDANFTMQWLEVINRLAKNDYGLPIAYENAEQEIITNPSAKTIVTATAIFVIVNEGKICLHSEIQHALST
ncbi:MAG: potassium channel family protein [Alphaproteobacteria bacterium]|nr:potassium channel family protein [Alphaproteobacteria bacterium]